MIHISLSKKHVEKASIFIYDPQRSASQIANRKKLNPVA